ncbi:MAG: RsmB/NOP family class I SAM-dependent RNA methyltransferase [Myxococcota bacterium]
MDPLVLAGHLYALCLASKGSLDKTVSRFLREHRQLPGEARSVLVTTVYGMLRSRRWLEYAAGQIPGRLDRSALVQLYLLRAASPPGGNAPVLGRVDKAWRGAIHAANAAPLPIQCSLPDWLCTTLLEELGAVEGAEVARSLAGPAPTTLRTNELLASRDDVALALGRDGFDTKPTAHSPWGLVVQNPADLFRSESFQRGLFEVQDEASQLAALLADARPGQLVVDGCAGAGGKTLALAAMMQNKGRLLAFDVATHRLEDLKRRARRAQVHNLRVTALPPTSMGPLQRLVDKADVVFVDAPCSGTGILRRNPDTAWNLKPDDVERMRGQQEQILERYARLVKPGGRLVYATCSVLRDENEAQVELLRQKRPDLEVEPASAALARYGVDLPLEGHGLRLYPHRHGTDGFFATVFVRRG